MRPEYISVLEATYRMVDDEKKWLGDLLDAASPLIDKGLGTLAYQYSLHDELAQAKRTLVSRNVDQNFVEAVFKSMTQTPAEIVSEVHQPPMTFRYSFASQFFQQKLARGECDDFIPELGWPHGVKDMLGIFANDPMGVGCFIGVPYPEKGRLHSEAAKVWTRISAHIANSLRLRLKLSQTDVQFGLVPLDKLPTVEAVFTEDGKAEYFREDIASEHNCKRLQKAAMDVIAARTTLRDQPELALDVWQGLIDGSWSLVDHFESDGRRYLVAHRNELSFPDPRGLTEQERAVMRYLAMGDTTKEISYLMGIQPSTATTHAANLQAKLGLKSRVELIQLVAALEKSSRQGDLGSGLPD